ncbi:MAG: hypothetical protein Q4C55_01265 [Eubacterium sp.]|nr:hypothetical protein [Eubacterium sp.]
MTDISVLQNERNTIFKDFYNNTIPKRMPVIASLPLRALSEYSGENLVDTQFKFDVLKTSAEEICQKLYSDKCPIKGPGGTTRSPSKYQLLKSQSFTMGNNGYMQHPEVSAMEADEYKELATDPFAFLLEKVIPRQYKGLDASSPWDFLLNYLRADLSTAHENAEGRKIIRPLTQKFGYYNGAPFGCMGFTSAPYDFIADQLRGFSNISMDIRRHRTEIAEACDAIMPFLFYAALPDNPDPQGCVGTPLHMPPFMREKDFAEVWLPSYLKMFQQYASLGIRGQAFCEGDWSRYLDYLTEFPAGMELKFEYGDPKAIKDKLGDKYIIQGLYPLGLLKTGTRQECIDKAKELLDIMLPGGGYLFGFDKNPISLSDVNFDNYCAVMEFVRDYAHYDNAGQSYGTPINQENYSFDSSILDSVQSKYLFNWPQYKNDYPMTPDFAKDLYLGYDKKILNTLISMLM